MREIFNFTDNSIGLQSASDNGADFCVIFALGAVYWHIIRLFTLNFARQSVEIGKYNNIL